jgi:hypothetical protein
LQAISKSWPQLVAGDNVMQNIGILNMSHTNACAAQLALLPLVDHSIQAQ